MKKTLKLLVVIVACIITLISCEKNESIFVEESASNMRVVFDSKMDLFDTYTRLMDMNYEDQTRWIDSVGIDRPLYKNIEFCNDEVMIELPRAFSLLFNKDLEVQVADTVVVFDNGKMLVRSIGDQTLSYNLEFATVELNNIESEPKTRGTILVLNKYGKVFASHQQEFFIPGNKHKFKYVHDYKTLRIYLNDNLTIYQLFMDLKLEYRGSRKWKVASEPRSIVIDLHISGHPIPISIKRNNIVYNHQINMFQIHCLNHNHSTVHINLSGSITQTINGVPGSKWIDTY